MNIKKIAASFLAAAVAAGSLAVGSFAVDIGVTDGVLDEETGLLYVPWEDGTLMATIPGGANLSGDIVIPETFGEGENAKTVSRVHTNFIYDPWNITSLSIPKTVVAFEDYLSSSTSSHGELSSITVDKDNPAFASEDGILFNKDKTEIIKFPFAKSASEYAIPNGVKVIGDACFAGTELQSITLPDSVITIEWGAFWHCRSLSELNIPGSVEAIGGSTIMDSNVSQITVDSSNENYCVVDNVLFSADKKILVAFPIGSDVEEYTIPDGTEYILSEAFSGDVNIKKVTIPQSVTDMGNYTFHQCTNLISAEIPNKVTNIKGTFLGCKKLETVTLPLSLTKIGGQTFRRCENLKTVNYAGTKADWDKIEIESLDNEALNNAQIIFSDGTTGGTDITDERQDPAVTPSEDGMTNDFIPEVVKTNNVSAEDFENMKKVKASAPTDAFEKPVNMSVAPSNSFTSGTGTSFAVNITFKDENGGEVQPKEGTTVKVMIPVPENMKNSENIYVYHINDEGKPEKIKAERITIDKTEYMVFDAEHFSTYALTDTEVKTEETGNGGSGSGSSGGNGGSGNGSSGSSGSGNGGSGSTDTSDKPESTTSTETSSEPETPSEPTSSAPGYTESETSAPDSAPTAPESNPSTGVAVSILPIVAAVSAVVVIKKRK